ncbi:hypothetical protein [Tenuifilum osseticum]|uniref:hypothetical protein n=1 Tax=Tenuifilum osseticum TaxID=3374723 RepID=UPI0034E55EA7
MYKVGFLVAIFFTCTLTFAQNTIEGKVKSSDGVFVSDISITVHPKDNTSKILSYCYSDENGVFVLKIDSKSDSVLLFFRSLQIKDTALLISNSNHKLFITLYPKINNIDEVKVASSPIRVKGDTISYLVSSFATENDFSIGDVIDKMPGFKVDENGKISYQGKEIRKYYIEGMDLLEGNYSLANKNLPQTSVASVEVLLNHQPIKAVGTAIPTDETALNIKLKNNVALTGVAKGTIGQKPIMWDVNTTPMAFQKRQQIILSWQNNNLGNSMFDQHQSITINNGEVDGLYTIKDTYVSTPNISFPNVKKAVFTDNNTNLMTYNQIVKFSKEVDIKINASYLKNRIDVKKLVSRSYFLTDSIFTIDENQTNSLLGSSFIGNITITKNSKSAYFKNKINYGGFWDENESSISNTNFLQDITATPFHQTLTNQFELVIPIQKYFIQMGSVVDYNYSPQELFMRSTGSFLDNFGDSLIQKISNRTFNTQNSISFTLPIGNWLLASNISYNYKNFIHNTSMIDKGKIVDIDSLINNLDWQNSSVKLQEEINYTLKKVRFILKIPVLFSKINANDHYHNLKIDKNFVTVNPFISVKFNLFKTITFYSYVGFKQSTSEPIEMLRGYTIPSYRNLNVSYIDFALNNTFYYNFHATFRMPSAGLFGSLSWDYSKQHKNAINNHVIYPSGYIINSLVNQSLIGNNQSFNSSLSWFINAIKTTLKVETIYSFTNIPILVNDMQQVFRVNTLSLTPSMFLNFSSFFNLRCSSEVIKSRAYYGNLRNETVDYNNELDIYFLIKAKHILGLEANFYNSKTKNLERNSALISNFFYKYNPSKSRLTFEFKIRNLFNSKRYLQIYSSESEAVRTLYYLHPREYLFTVGWTMGKSR